MFTQNDNSVVAPGSVPEQTSSHLTVSKRMNHHTSQIVTLFLLFHLTDNPVHVQAFVNMQGAVDEFDPTTNIREFKRA